MSDEQEKLLNKIKVDPTIFNIQKYISKMMLLRGFAENTTKDRLLLLTEEVGELAKAIRLKEKYLAVDLEQIDHFTKVKDEVADVFIVLLALCDVMKIDLFSAFIDKEKENIRRRWS